MVLAKASLQQKLKKLIYQFNIYGDFIVGIPFGNGHVNDTFSITLTGSLKTSPFMRCNT